jgi:hypothetical protein
MGIQNQGSGASISTIFDPMIMMNKIVNKNLFINFTIVFSPYYYAYLIDSRQWFEFCFPLDTYGLP